MVSVAYQNMVIFQNVIGGSGWGAGFGPALAVSCAMHLLLLWPELPPPAGGQPRPALAASLRLTGAAEARLASTPAETRHSLEARQPASVPSARHGHRRLGEAVGPPPLQSERLPQGEASPVAAPAAAGRGEAPEASAEAALPDADGIRAYRIGLAREARANKRYPPLARERGWAGVSEVQVEVSREGLPRQTLLARSSGHELLDREALDLMARAAAATVPPESLRGRAFTVRLPVVFELEEK